MSVFSATIGHRSYIWQITIVCFVLGLVLAASVNTTKQLSRSGQSTPKVGFTYGNSQVLVEKAAQYESEINKLRDQKTELENKLAKRTDAAGTINKDLQDTKFLAGLTEAEGEGVQVTLVDSSKTSPFASDQANISILIHDKDVSAVVNELAASGAEAVSVNGQRIVAQSSIRCVGPVIHVNGVPAAPPFVIKAIGNAETLNSGINMRNGVLEDLRRFDPNMARVEKKSLLHLPAFAGSTTMRYARLPAASHKKEKEVEQK